MSKERAVKYIISKYDTMKEWNDDVIEFDVGKTAFKISERMTEFGLNIFNVV